MLSKDAILFGLGFLNGTGRTLSLSGRGKLSERADRALSELVFAGYAMRLPGDGDGSETWSGTDTRPTIGEIAKTEGVSPFDEPGFNLWRENDLERK